MLLHLILTTTTLAAITMPAIFSDGMLLQTNRASGLRSFLWGYSTATNTTITIDAPRGPYHATPSRIDGRWEVTLSPGQPGPSFTVSVFETNAPSVVHVAKNVVFGDAYLCVGGPSMASPLGTKFNAVSIAKLRYFDTALGTWHIGSNTSDVGWWSQRASSLCVQSLLSDGTNAQMPKALVVAASAEAQSLVEWAPRAVLARCGAATAASGASRFNATLQPLLPGLSIKAAIWAQAETSTSVLDARTHACVLRGMVTAWRDLGPTGDFAVVAAVVTPPTTNGGAGSIEALASSSLQPRPSPRLVPFLLPRVFGDDGIDVDTCSVAVSANASLAALASSVALGLAHTAFAQQPPAKYHGPILASASQRPRQARDGQEDGGNTVVVVAIDFLRSSVGASGLTIISTDDPTTACPNVVRLCTPLALDPAHCDFPSVVSVDPADNATLLATFQNISQNLFVGENVVILSFSAACQIQNEFGNPAAGGAESVAYAFDAVETNGVATLEDLSSPRSKPLGPFATPQMGFNAWNAFHCSVSERLLMQTADALVETGLAKLGFTHINLDDCWMVERNASDGTIGVDPVRFPSGMKALANYIHSKGLSFGIYTAPASTTPQGRPGLFQHEAIDVKTFCEWGVDYLKLDSKGSTVYGTPNGSWVKVRAAIDVCPTPIYLQVAFCKHVGSGTCGDWIGDLANAWRTSGDVQATWASVLGNADLTQPLWPLVGPHNTVVGGTYNDADMLEVGNIGLNPTEMRTHFALWVFLTSPLLISTNVNDLLTKPSKKDQLELLQQPELIAINQDSLGLAARKVNPIGVVATTTSHTNTATTATAAYHPVLRKCSTAAAESGARWVYSQEARTLSMEANSSLVLTVKDCAPFPSHESPHLTILPLTVPSTCKGANTKWFLNLNGTIVSDIVAKTIPARSTRQCIDIPGQMPGRGVTLHACDGPQKKPTPGSVANSQAFAHNASGTGYVKWGRDSGFEYCLVAATGATPTPAPSPPRPGDAEVWQKLLHDGSVALLIFNRGDVDGLRVNVSFSNVTNIEAGQTVHVRDVWAGVNDPDARGSVERVLPAHGSAVLRLTPVHLVP